MTSFSAFISTAGTIPQNSQDIGQTIRDAVQEATQDVRQEAAQAARDAQREVAQAQRDAQQQVREARTADQRGGANQALFGAQQALRGAEAALRAAERQTRSGTVVYTGQPPFDARTVIPPQAVDIAIGFFITCAVIIVGWPISRALGRRFERRGAPPAIEAGMTDQLQRIEQAVEAIAIEVERISESQRFLAKLQEKSPTAIE